MDEIKQAIQNLQHLCSIACQQNATLIHQVTMLQIHNSIGLINLSLIKLSTKTSSISPSAPNPSNNDTIPNDDTKTISQSSYPNSLQLPDSKAATSLVDSGSAPEYAKVVPNERPKLDLKPWALPVKGLVESIEKERESVLGKVHNMFVQMIKPSELSFQLTRYENSSSSVRKFYFNGVLESLLIVGGQNMFIFDPGGHARKYNETGLSQNFNKENTLSVSEDKAICQTSAFKDSLFSFDINETQKNAIQSCLSIRTDKGKQPLFKLILGPPGTGKTNTIAILLQLLQKMRCIILTCAPTNTSVVQDVSRLLPLINKDFVTGFVPYGDIVLFGNKDRLKIVNDRSKIFLDCHVKKLLQCLTPKFGGKFCLNLMQDFFDTCIIQYHKYKEEQYLKGTHIEADIFLVYVRKNFKLIADDLVSCFNTLLEQLPRRVLPNPNINRPFTLIGLLQSFRKYLDKDIREVDAKAIFTKVGGSHHTVTKPKQIRFQCTEIIMALQETLKLPLTSSKFTISYFCLQNATLILYTACSSCKQQSVNKMGPIEFVLIDEAAQLKECESSIPLLTYGLRHDVLIGDECQLPAMGQSKVSENALLGRSLFQRMSSLGHKKHLLNIQRPECSQMRRGDACFTAYDLEDKVDFEGMVMIRL